ncbi:MAG: hypothetical protein KF770_17300 [Anaerolineae bacterium]|nr:hypothetical protein [Anaerolineae bacterium]
MDGNYEWQKNRANERIQARLQEAEAHRQGKQGNGRTPLLPLKVIIPVLMGMIIAMWLLTGCGPAGGTVAVEPETAVITAAAYPLSGQRMAERIRFQDKRENYLREETAVKPAAPRPVWTMADRIRFQDRVEGTRP